MTTTTAATDKQTALIVSLCNRINGTRHGYLSQVRDHIGISSSKCQRLTKVEASAIIDKLMAQVKK